MEAVLTVRTEPFKGLSIYTSSSQRIVCLSKVVASSFHLSVTVCCRENMIVSVYYRANLTSSSHRA